MNLVMSLYILSYIFYTHPDHRFDNLDQKIYMCHLLLRYKTFNNFCIFPITFCSSAQFHNILQLIRYKVYGTVNNHYSLTSNNQELCIYCDCKQKVHHNLHNCLCHHSDTQAPSTSIYQFAHLNNV